MPGKVLAIVPHPDDAEYYAGGLIARLAGDGAQVVIAVTTDGIKGSFELAGSELADTRTAEMQAACKVLGAEPPLFLGYTDFELEKLPAGVLREKYIRLIREHRPDTVITEDPFWLGETHPDHRAVAMAAMEAIQYARLPRVHSEHLDEGLETHIVSEKYFYSEEAARANRVIDITPYFAKKIAALAEHRSQIEFLVEGLLREARLAGVDLKAALGDMAEDKLALFTMGMRMQAAEIGAAHGYELAEMYHYERFHPLVEGLTQRASGT